MLLRWTERNVAGLPSKSAVDFGVGRKYFVFQLIVVWLFSTVIGIMLIETPKIRGFKSSGVPLYDLGKILSSNPRLVRVWLARSIPQQVRPAASACLCVQNLPPGQRPLGIRGVRSSRACW